MKPRKLLWLSLLIVASLVVPAFLQFYVVLPQVAIASPGEYLANPSFTGGTTNWTLSVTTYDSVTYQDTAGSIKTNPDVGRNNEATGTATQTISTSINPSDTVYLSLYWKKSYALVAPVKQILEVQIEKPSTPGIWTTIWSDTQIGNFDWTSVGPIDVSSYFDETGTYGFRFYMNPRNGNHASAETHIWVDNTSLDVTPPPVPPTVGTITISPSSMTPQEQWTNITVPVTDNDTLADVNEVYVEVFYDSAGDDPTAPGTADVQTCAILTWTRGGSPVWDIAPASTTWAINADGCSNGTDSQTTDNWLFSFKVGKVATHSPGSDDWDIYANATDSINQTGDNDLRDVEMNWYGEITVETSTVSWGIVSPGCSNETSPVVNITYICNGNYTEQVKTSQNWTSASGNVTLNTTGSPDAGEFSLKADDDATIEGAVQVLSASYTTFDTGTQTIESGNVENNNHLWLSLGSGIPVDTYSGTLYFGIVAP